MPLTADKARRRTMGKRAEGEGATDGATLEENLIRLGISETTVRVAEVAEKSGMSRARIYALFNSLRIRPETIAKIAKGLGVDPAELTRPSPRPKSPPPARGKGKGKGKG